MFAIVAAFLQESLSSNLSSRVIDPAMKEFIDEALEQTDLMGTMAEMSVAGFSSSMGVQEFTALTVDAASTVVEGILGDNHLAKSILGLTKAFPFTAALGGVFAGFLVDVLADFGLFGPSESQQLYDKIMQDVGAMIAKSEATGMELMSPLPRNTQEMYRQFYGVTISALLPRSTLT